jgi:uncharacterized repeat protein (TIGR03803 family)
MKFFKNLPLVMTFMVMCLTVSSVRGGIMLTTLVSFTGTNGAYPGANPYAGLVLAPDGNFYGAAPNGGANGNGTIFEISADGSFFTNIYNFSGGTNGANPIGALISGADGNFYGTTYNGGVSNWGTIFQISTNGTYTGLGLLGGANGAHPDVALIQGTDGSLYGATKYGGPYPKTTSGGTGYGVIFRITTNGTLSTPVVFDSTNGANAAALVRGNDGNFYGTTAWGGSISQLPLGYGTIFQLNPDGTFDKLYKFTGGNDGGFPYASLVEGNDGNFYGTTYNGGTNQLGTVFSITPGGQFKALYSFMSSNVGGYPYGGLVQGSDGNLYGTTYIGGGNQFGTIFEITTDGNLTRLISFSGTSGPSLGANPLGALVQGTDGNFYGTTSLGGANGLGTIFRLSVPMPAVFKAITLTNGTATLTWSAVVGQTYQVQYSTNLTQTNWNSLGKPGAASNGTMTTTDSGAASSPQRFYRVILFP